MITFCISTYNNLEYLKLAIPSVRNNSYYNTAPFIVHAENCTDGTNEWLEQVKDQYDLQIYIDMNDSPKGIGGGMNFCVDNVTTEFFLFLHSDFYVTKNWDKALLDLFDKYPDQKLWVNSWRVEPHMFPSSNTSPGNIVVPKDYFGEYYYNFDSKLFDEWADDFISQNDIEIPRGLGASCLMRKSDWDYIGGNDPIFAPTSWDDFDLLWRMLNEGYKFITTTKSLIYHFGARGSHRLEENNHQSSERQVTAERKNVEKFINKWGGLPLFDEYEMITNISK